MENITKLSQTLLRKKLKIATAESCTGGLLGSVLTSVPGSSAYFELGLITYSNDAKINLLGVNKNTIYCFGAVSKNTAREMAERIKEIANSNIGVGITGIAGPAGGSIDKPVGLVYIAIALDNNTNIYKNIFTGNREEIREKSVSFVINKLNDLLQGD